MFSNSVTDQYRKLFHCVPQPLGRYFLADDYQLDLFSTGSGSFAICLRYGPPNDSHLLVYDGGTAENGRTIVEHIRKHYDDQVIDDLVCSHPVAGQCLGLIPILENIEVKRFWMHRPWLHSNLIASALSGQHRVDPELSRHFEETISLTYLLEDLAHRTGVPIHDPFQGEQIGPMRVMSPHRDWYSRRLIHDFVNPPPKVRCMAPELTKLLTRLGTARTEQRGESSDTTQADQLSEFGACSAEMESSVVLYGLIGGRGILLTGNAGPGALFNTAEFAQHLNIHLPQYLNFFQVPRFGHSDHLSPSVLDRLIGSPVTLQRPRLTAFISTPSGQRGFPHQSVVKALVERGAQVMHAEGKILDSVIGSATETWSPSGKGSPRQ